MCCVRWSDDGAWVYFSEPNSGLRRVPAGGGTPEVVTTVDAAGGDQVHVHPEVLPGGGGVVFKTRGPDGDRIQAVDVATGDLKDLTPGNYPLYASTGHLLFVDDDGNLLAAPFDVERLEMTGAAVPVVEGLALNTQGTAYVSVSQTGTLVYRTGSIVSGTATPVWVDRTGVASEVDPGWGSLNVRNNSGPALSPDGTRLALSIDDAEGRQDVWVKQLDAGPLARLTYEGTGNSRPAWSPDGQFLTFLSTRGGNIDLWTKRADGSDTAALLLDRDVPLQEVAYSPDSDWLIFREGLNAVADIYALRLPMDSAAVRLNAALEGRYRIESELGEGGMATVYLADDLKHERKVALKVLKPELAAVVGAERFLAEIKTTANLQHPHILPLFDSGEADTFLFYVMPYVEGETLRDRLDREHQLPVDDAVQIAKNVAEALDYAHKQGVIHRDIKPANILLQAGKPVISDFGIALAVGVAGGVG